MIALISFLFYVILQFPFFDQLKDFADYIPISLHDSVSKKAAALSDSRLYDYAA